MRGRHADYDAAAGTVWAGVCQRLPSARHAGGQLAPFATPCEDLLEALGETLAGTAPFTVRNHGVRRLDRGLVYDLHALETGPNPALVLLAATIDEVVRPLVAPAAGFAADTYEPGRWHAHLSLASHDLYERPDLRDEIEEFVHGLGVEPPSRFTADTVALYRFEHDDWTGSWWRTMEWRHVRSWRLSG